MRQFTRIPYRVRVMLERSEFTCPVSFECLLVSPALTLFSHMRGNRATVSQHMSGLRCGYIFDYQLGYLLSTRTALHRFFRPLRQVYIDTSPPVISRLTLQHNLAVAFRPFSYPSVSSETLNNPIYSRINFWYVSLFVSSV